MSEHSDEKIHLDGPVVAVDDDEIFRKELKEILERNGIACVFQESATHAVRYFQNQPWNWKPGLIITDIVMDGMGGYQLIRRINELYQGRNIPIVVISRLNAGVDVGEAEVAGASAYLTKPLNEEQLIKIIRRVTDKNSKGIIVFTHEDGMRVLSR
jgi:twitching motility two-component system response regulator PilH